MPEHATETARSGDQERSTAREGETTTDPRARDAQSEYVRSLQTPAQKARSAIRAAALPIDHLIPDNVVSFDQKPDGSFTLKLGGEVRYPIGDVTLVLTTTITGRLGSGEMSGVQGIYGEKKVAFFTGKGNVTKVVRAGDDLIIHTDNSMAKEIKLKVADVKAVG